LGASLNSCQQAMSSTHTTLKGGSAGSDCPYNGNSGGTAAAGGDGEGGGGIDSRLGLGGLATMGWYVWSILTLVEVAWAEGT
jgi:hypothetical protein